MLLTIVYCCPSSIKKLRKIFGIIDSRINNDTNLKTINIFNNSNIEKIDMNCYSYNQMSVGYLLIATKLGRIDDSSFELASHILKQREAMLDASGLDMNSCLQFLLDYFIQLIQPQVIIIIKKM